MQEQLGGWSNDARVGRRVTRALYLVFAEVCVIFLADVGSAAGAGFLGLFGIVLFFAAIALYFVPTIIAFVRKKSNKTPILVLNLLLGWSLIGWVVSLVWALSQDQQPIIVQQTFHQGSYVPSAVGTSVVEHQGEA